MCLRTLSFCLPHAWLTGVAQALHVDAALPYVKTWTICSGSIKYNKTATNLPATIVRSLLTALLRESSRGGDLHTGRVLEVTPLSPMVGVPIVCLIHSTPSSSACTASWFTTETWTRVCRWVVADVDGCAGSPCLLACLGCCTAVPESGSCSDVRCVGRCVRLLRWLCGVCVQWEDNAGWTSGLNYTEQSAWHPWLVRLGVVGRPTGIPLGSGADACSRILACTVAQADV